MKKITIGISSIVTTIVLLISGQPDGLLHFYALDVGQGDALFFRTPSGKTILVDGGPGNAVLKELDGVLPFFNRTINYVVLTHTDRDHIEGLIYVLQRYPVEHVYVTGYYKAGGLVRAFMREVEERHIPITLADAQSDIVLADGTTIDIIFPFKRNLEVQPTVNNTSLIAKVIYGAHSILLTGDSEAPEEDALLAHGDDLSAEILKVGHHGSKTSTTSDFLAKVHPRYGVISVGRNNSYHHPHPSTLKKLEEEEVQTVRTDVAGRIEFVFDATNIVAIKKKHP